MSETDEWRVKKTSLRMFIEGGCFLIKGPTSLEELKDIEKWDTAWLTMIQDDLMSAFMAIQNEIIRRAYFADEVEA